MAPLGERAADKASVALRRQSSDMPQWLRDELPPPKRRERLPPPAQQARSRRQGMSAALRLALSACEAHVMAHLMGHGRHTSHA